jgi:hypothetical protein
MVDPIEELETIDAEEADIVDDVGEAADFTAINSGAIGYNNTSSNSNSHSSAAPSPASSLLTSSSIHLTEAEALLQLSNQESDEGIVSDQSSSADPDDASKRVKIEHVRIIYQCTWPPIYVSYLDKL